jgi:hypothetical protein
MPVSSVPNEIVVPVAALQTESPLYLPAGNVGNWVHDVAFKVRNWASAWMLTMAPRGPKVEMVSDAPP